MTATDVIEQIKALPEAERKQVALFVLKSDKSWIPDSFRQGMLEAERGEFVDMEVALHEKPPQDK
jgi:predicted transcriptional regulator